jgi:hypothetical protein
MSTIRHSLYGKLFGLDANNYLTSPVGVKVPQVYAGVSGSEVAVMGSTSVQAATSATTATNITAGGITTVSSAATTWQLAAPVAGVPKWLSAASSSTATRTITVASGSQICCTAGTSMTSIVLTGGGQGVTLVGISTAIYQVVNNSGATFS